MLTNLSFNINVDIEKKKKIVMSEASGTKPSAKKSGSKIGRDRIQ